MKNTAVVVYIGPKIASNYTIWCLEPVHGTPVLLHLLRRLQKGLPLGEFEFFVACHGDVMPDKMKPLLKESPVKLFVSGASGRLLVFTELAEANKHLATLLIFPEEAIFPDCRLALQMLRLHREQHMEGTASSEHPAGLMPEIYETAALHRLAELDLPDDLSKDFASVMDKANQLFEEDEDKDLRFKLLWADRDHLPGGPTMEKLPSRLLIDNAVAQKAAEQVLDRVSSKIRFDSTEACLFKEEFLRLEAAPSFRFPTLPPARAGAIPVLFVAEHWGFTGAEQSFANLIIHLDRTRFQPYVVLASRGVLSEKLIAAGIPVEITYFNFLPLTPWNTRYFDALLKHLGIKIVHVNGFEDALAMAAYYAGIPVVYHVRALHGRNAPWLLKYAARIITVSEAVARDLRCADLDPGKVKCIYNGQDLISFKPENYNRAQLRNEAGIPLDVPVICLIARITAQKRMEVLLEALPTVLQKFPKAIALIVGECYPGEAPYYEHLQKTIERLRLQQAVRFWGFEKDIAKVHAMSDVLVNCTLNEPFGRSILEALAMGVPVVVPTQGGHTEILRHYENGILYDARNPQNLGTELVRLLNTPELSKKLVQNGLKIIQNFDIGTHVRKVSELYEKLLSESAVFQEMDRDVVRTER